MRDLATAESSCRDLVPGGGWIHPRINFGRIVVDCPSPHCTSALILPPGWPLYACWDCPTIAAIIWPDNLADIASVLLLRPDPNTRSWWPGESLEELVAENLAHGVGVGEHGEHLPPEGGPVLLIVDGRIVDGHPALTGPIQEARRAIARYGLIRALDPEPEDPTAELRG